MTVLEEDSQIDDVETSEPELENEDDLSQLSLKVLGQAVVFFYRLDN